MPACPAGLPGCAGWMNRPFRLRGRRWPWPGRSTPTQRSAAYAWAWIENAVMSAVKAVPLGQARRPAPALDARRRRARPSGFGARATAGRMVELPARPGHRQQPSRNPVFTPVPILRCPDPKPSRPPFHRPACRVWRLPARVAAPTPPSRPACSPICFCRSNTLRARARAGAGSTCSACRAPRAARSPRRWPGAPRPTGRGPKARAGCCTTGTANKASLDPTASRPCGGANISATPPASG